MQMWLEFFLKCVNYQTLMNEREKELQGLF